MFFILLLIVLIGFHLTKERMLEEQQERLDKELLDYVEKLELMHDELASFRHDYMNILLTLDEGVRNQSLTLIEQVYYNVIAPTSKLINNHELDIVKLSRVHVPEVKSVLSVKVITAQHQTIEEVVSTKDKVLQVAFFETGEHQYFIVRNSCNQEEVDM